MTRIQFNITMSAGGIGLLLVILIIIFGQLNRGLERTAQIQQITINRASYYQQIGRNLIGDLAQISLKDAKIKELLTRNGYTVNQNQPAEGASR
jgi:hypothetical protein